MIQIIIPSIFRVRMHVNLLRARANSAVQILQMETKNVSVKICSDAEMRTFNKTYRGIDQTTDVLSFVLDFKEPHSNENYLGDIVISYQTAKKQAREHHQSLEDEMTFLLIHGLLHLSGYDHETLADERKMFSRQENIFKKVLEKKNE
jgi:probable rRNA maturation factor